LTTGSQRRAAIYARVSTDEQARDGTSLATQRQRCRAYIEAQGWDFADEFVDEGVSGAKASRPRLDALMRAARQGAADVIVVAKLDRFGRSMRHLSNALGDLDDWGVAFVSIAEAFDSASSSGRLHRNMLGAFAEFEREQIRDRMMAGQRATVTAGYWPAGPPPHGYKIVRDGAHKRLELDENESEAIRVAVAVILDEGGTVGDASNRLNALGFRRRRGGRWTRIQLRRRLLSDHWSGQWTWRSRTDAPVVLTIPPILPVDRMVALHTALRAAPGSYPRSDKRQTFYSLSGRLIGVCGAPYSGVFRNDRLIRDYRCRNRNIHAVENGQKCADKWIHADDLERVVWDTVTQLLSEPERLLKMARDFLGLRGDQVKIEREHVADIDRKIVNLEQALARAYADRYLVGDQNAMNLAISQLEGDLKGLRDHRSVLESWQTENLAESARVRRLWELADLAHTQLPSMSPRQQAAVYNVLDVRVTVLEHATRRAPTRVRIEGRLFDGDPLLLPRERPPERTLEDLRAGNSRDRVLRGTAPRWWRRRPPRGEARCCRPR
jgi:DNA invertase Pin-like site-specific DNA recombinase